MASIFSGMRKRGGITGLRNASIDAMGISWDEIKQKRHLFFESLKDDVDNLLENLCERRDFDRTSIGVCRSRKSVMCIPQTLRTPGPPSKIAARTKPALGICNDARISEEPSFEYRSLRKRKSSASSPEKERTKVLRKGMVLREGVNLDRARESEETKHVRKPKSGHGLGNEQNKGVSESMLSETEPVPKNVSTREEKVTKALPDDRIELQLSTEESDSGRDNETMHSECLETKGTDNSSSVANDSLPVDETPTEPLCSDEANDSLVSSRSVNNESDYETCASTQGTPVVNSAPLHTAVPYLQKSSCTLEKVKERLNTTYSVMISPISNIAAYKKPSTSIERKCEQISNESRIDLISETKEAAIASSPSSTSSCPCDEKSPEADNSDPQCLRTDSPINEEAPSCTLITTTNVAQYHSPQTDDTHSLLSADHEMEYNKQVFRDKWKDKMRTINKQQQQQIILPPSSSSTVLSEGVKASLAPIRNSPVKAMENQKLKRKRLAEKVAEKAEREAARKRELELKKEQERLERIRKREERMKRIADNQAALQKKEKEKWMKIKELKVVKKDKKKDLEEKNMKLKERQMAAEQRRLEQEKQKKQKLKEIEEEKRIVEEIHRKKLQLEEEERQRKKQEKAEIEKERIKRKEELDNKKKQEGLKNVNKQAAKTAHNKKQLIDNESRERIKQTWKAVEESFKKISEEMEANSQESSTETDVNGSNEATVDENNCETVDENNCATVAKSMDEMMKCLKQWENNIMKDQQNSSDQKPCTTKPGLSSKYQDVSTYEITPITQNPLLEADDYGIDDLQSDNSTDDEDDPKKAVPMWAAPMNLLKTIQQQENGSLSATSIFPPEELLQSPNLAKIFPKLKKRFFKRTSSAQWSSPMLKKYKK